MLMIQIFISFVGLMNVRDHIQTMLHLDVI